MDCKASFPLDLEASLPVEAVPLFRPAGREESEVLVVVFAVPDQAGRRISGAHRAIQLGLRLRRHSPGDQIREDRRGEAGRTIGPEHLSRAVHALGRNRLRLEVGRHARHVAEKIVQAGRRRIGDAEPEVDADGLVAADGGLIAVSWAGGSLGAMVVPAETQSMA
jgi:hypothetical protein